MARYLQRVNLQGNECTYNDAASSSPGVAALACMHKLESIAAHGRPRHMPRRAVPIQVLPARRQRILPLQCPHGVQAHLCPQPILHGKHCWSCSGSTLFGATKGSHCIHISGTARSRHHHSPEHDGM